MNYVEIYKLQNDGSQKVEVVFKFVDGSVVAEGENSTLINNIVTEGIVDYSGSGNLLFPKDGMHFLEQLKYNFKSAYLNASDILGD